MTTIRCSRFNHARDNEPKPLACTWPELKELHLERAYQPRRGSVGDEAKKSLPGISGTRFQARTLRGIEHAVDLGLMIFDFDNSREEPTGEFWPNPKTGKPTNRPKLRKVLIDNPVTFDEVQETLWDAGADSYTWSTWSAKPDWPKFRVVLPLAHPIPAALWAAATEWALDRLGFASIRRGLDMPVLRDVARLNFLPGAPDPGSIRRGETMGEHLAIPLDGLPKAPPLPVAPWQQEVLEMRTKAKMTGAQWWQSYRVGGRPVDFLSLDLASLLSGRGFKVGAPKPHKNGTKWRCQCPLGQEHSGGGDDDSAVVIQTPGQWPSFSCAHSHHAHLSLLDVIEQLWGTP